MLHKAALTRPVIVTFVSEDYIPVGLNWVERVQRLAPDADILVFALDAKTALAFDPAIVRLRPMEGGGLSSLWVHRMRVLCELMDEGRDVIHSDADAVWIADPLPYILGCEKQMVFSQGTIWPPDVHTRHGLVLCCGLFYLRNTPDVRAFLQEVDRRMPRDLDDQICINRLISERGVVWEFTSSYEIPFRNQVFRASIDPIYADVAELPSLAVLPHHLFPRMVETLHADTLVAHPVTPKTCEGKIEALSQLGLWG